MMNSPGFTKLYIPRIRLGLVLRPCLMTQLNILFLSGILSFVLLIWIFSPGLALAQTDPEFSEAQIQVLVELGHKLATVDELQQRGFLSEREAEAQKQRYLAEAQLVLPDSINMVLLELKYKLATMDDLEQHSHLSQITVEAQKHRYLAEAQKALGHSLEREQLLILLDSMGSHPIVPTPEPQPIVNNYSIPAGNIIWTLSTIVLAILVGWLIRPHLISFFKQLSPSRRAHLTTAEQATKEGQVALNHQGDYAVKELALARLVIAQSQSRQDSSAKSSQQTPGLQPILSSLDRQLQVAEREEHPSRIFEILILQAMALQAQGNTDKALSILQRALALAETEDHLFEFVDEGTTMVDLLRQAVGIAPDYISRLRAIIQETQLGPNGSLKAKPQTEIVEPLTKREIEILTLVAEGCSNHEIARRFVIAPGTVKVHLSNIYGKLAVKNRTQAVAKARVLNILSST